MSQRLSTKAGQVHLERMNRTLKDATVKRYHYDNHDQLRRHLCDFVAASTFARRLKTLKGLTPYEAICQAWVKEAERFISDPTYQTPGPKHLASGWIASLSTITPHAEPVEARIPASRR